MYELPLKKPFIVPANTAMYLVTVRCKQNPFGIRYYVDTVPVVAWLVGGEHDCHPIGSDGTGLPEVSKNLEPLLEGEITIDGKAEEKIVGLRKVFDPATGTLFPPYSGKRWHGPVFPDEQIEHRLYQCPTLSDAQDSLLDQLKSFTDEYPALDVESDD